MEERIKHIEKQFAEEIRDAMCCLGFPNQYGHVEDSDEYMFQIVKKLSCLISELLDDESIKTKLLMMSIQSESNGTNVETKLELFEMIRNVIVHFPIFHKWSEIYINRDLMKWNMARDGKIISFFDNHKDEQLEYYIYTKQNDTWEIAHRVSITIPELTEHGVLYLKDIISLYDVVWTFCIIDYYLDYVGEDPLMRYSGLSV